MKRLPAIGSVFCLFPKKPVVVDKDELPEQKASLGSLAPIAGSPVDT